MRRSEATWPGPDSRATALARMRLLIGLAVRGGIAGRRGAVRGELVEQVVVDAAGHDRDDGGVARSPGAASAGRDSTVLSAGWRTPGLRRSRRPVPDLGALVLAGEFVEADVELDLGGLPGPVGQAAAGDQPAASLLQGVVVALPLGPGVLRPGLLAQGVQHGLHGFGAAGGQVAVEPPGPAQGGLQPELPVLEPVIPVAVGLGEPAAHLLGQPGQVGEFGAAGRGAEQDLVGVAAGVLGQQVGPVADLPAPRTRRSGRRPGASATAGWAREPPHPPRRTRTPRRR